MAMQGPPLGVCLAEVVGGAARLRRGYQAVVSEGRRGGRSIGSGIFNTDPVVVHWWSEVTWFHKWCGEGDRRCRSGGLW